MPTDYHELVPVPPLNQINTGLSAASQGTMLELFGKPGRLTRDCSPITNDALKRQIFTTNTGHFVVEGWRPAVMALKAALAQCKLRDRSLYLTIQTAGMLCCRAVRGGSDYSNHSWGTAVDLKIDTQIDELGLRMVQKGILLLYPYMHAEGFFWAAGYHHRPDPMHFELADETVRRLHAAANP